MQLEQLLQIILPKKLFLKNITHNYLVTAAVTRIQKNRVINQHTHPRAGKTRNLTKKGTAHVGTAKTSGTNSKKSK